MMKITRFFEAIHLAFVEELSRLKRDTGALLILVFAVVFYPIVYSIAYKNNVLEDMPVAVVDADHSQLSRKAIRMLDASAPLNIPIICENMEQAKTLFSEGDVHGVIVIPSEFEKAIYSGKSADVGIYCDAGYFLKYKQTITASLQSLGTLAAKIEVNRMMIGGKHMEQALEARSPIETKFTMLYNPSSGYSHYVMPGMILVILQQTLLIGIGLLGGGRLETRSKGLSILQLAQKYGAAPVVFGQALSYLLVSVFNVFFALLFVYKWFGIVDNASFLSVILYLLPYLLATIFLGLSIAHIFKRREHAIMFLVFLSPIVLFLNGMSWPVTSIPKVLHGMAHLFPSTIAVPGYLRLRTMGVELSSVRSEWIGLVIQTLVYAVLAILSMRIYLRIQKSKNAL